MVKYKPPLKSLKGCGKALGANLHELRWERGKRRKSLEVEPLAFYPTCGQYKFGVKKPGESYWSRVCLLLCEECLVKHGIHW